MKSVGTYISGGAHVGLVVWMVVGWGTDADPLPIEVTEITMVSGDEFAAITQGIQPDLPTGSVEEPELPEIEEPELPTPTPIDETPPEVTPPPAPIETPAPEAPPEAPDLTVPETVVTDTPPDVPDTPTIVAPPPSAELGSSLRPVPRPASRVAPEIVAPPEPEATIAPETTVAATEQPEEPVEDEQEVADETTAPEEAADEIVTEAEEPTFAPEISSRPPSRPTRTAAAEPDEEPETETVSTSGGEISAEPEVVDPVAVALAEAAANPGLGGGELSDRQRADLRREIGGCWSVGSASTAALNTTVTVEWVMNPNGTIDSGSFELVDFSGGAQADADVAYRMARSAISRCQTGSGRSGYTLPADEFQEPVRLRLTFDPSEMRLR